MDGYECGIWQVHRLRSDPKDERVSGIAIKWRKIEIQGSTKVKLPTKGQSVARQTAGSDSNWPC